MDGVGCYGDGVGMKGITDQACRHSRSRYSRRHRRYSSTRFDSCSMPIDPADCFFEGGNCDHNYEVDGDEDDSDDEDEDDIS